MKFIIFLFVYLLPLPSFPPSFIPPFLSSFLPSSFYFIFCYQYLIICLSVSLFLSFSHSISIFVSPNRIWWISQQLLQKLLLISVNHSIHFNNCLVVYHQHLVLCYLELISGLWYHLTHQFFISIR